MEINIMAFKEVYLVAVYFLSVTLSKSITGEITGSEEICYHSNFTGSVRCCEEKGHDYRISLPDYEDITTLMNRYSLCEAWLPLKRKKLLNAAWVSGEDAGETCTHVKWPDARFNCGMWELREGSKYIKAGRCFESINKGVLCEKTECSGCSMILGLDTSLCERYINNNTCFIMNHGPFSWEGARHFCHQNNLQMAVLDSKEKCNFVKSFKYRRDCKQLWIGLRREEWHIPYSVNNTLIKPHWDEDEPSSGGNCSVIFKKGKDYWWKAEQCSKQHDSLCISLNAFEYVDRKPDTTPERHGEKTAATANPDAINRDVPGISSTVLVVVCLIAICLLYVTVKVKTGYKKTRSGQREVIELLNNQER